MYFACDLPKEDRMRCIAGQIFYGVTVHAGPYLKKESVGFYKSEELAKRVVDFISDVFKEDYSSDFLVDYDKYMRFPATFPSGLCALEHPEGQVAILHNQLKQRDWKDLTNRKFAGSRRMGEGETLDVGSETIAKVFIVSAKTEPFAEWHRVAIYQNKFHAKKSLRFLKEHRREEFPKGFELKMKIGSLPVIVREDFGLTLKEKDPEDNIIPIHTRYNQEHVQWLWLNSLGKEESF